MNFVEFWASQPVQIVVVLLVLGGVIFGFVREKLPPDLVAILAMGALLVLGILETQEVLGVFSNAAPLTVAAMFVLSAALERTGVLDEVGRWVTRLAKSGSPALSVACLLLGTIAVSAFVNNTPIVVILMPVAIQLAKAVNISPSRLLIPLSYAAILGGTTTMIGTSTNLVVDGAAMKLGLESFGVFEITGAGLIYAVVGCTYMLIASKWLLPERTLRTDALPDHGERTFLAQILVPFDSVLVGRTLAETGFDEDKGFNIIDVFRQNVSLRDNLSDVRIKAGDRIVMRSRVSEMLSLREQGSIAIGADASRRPTFEPVQATETAIMEGVVGRQSRLVGRRLSGLGLARLFGVYVLAAHRRGVDLVLDSKKFRFEVGDTLLIEGPPAGMRQLFDDGFLDNLTHSQARPFKRDKAPIAIMATVLVVILAAFDFMPIAGLGIIAAGLVVALGCIDHRAAYQSIGWDVLMLIYGMLCVGMAMEKSGAAELIVGGLAQVVGSLGPLAVLFTVYAFTTILTEFISNNAAAILMTPIAIGLGQSLGIDPRPLVVAVMFAASASFATPIGYQTNTLVYTSGGYKFMDFVRFGAPLSVILLITAMIVIPTFWPLQ